jgi:hypothetical protein
MIDGVGYYHLARAGQATQTRCQVYRRPYDIVLASLPGLM